jgi:hypothetical protein
MSDPTEVDNDLERLQMALEALSADLDAIMRRPHFSLRFAAENLVNSGSQRIERVVDHFAFAVVCRACERIKDAIDLKLRKIVFNGKWRSQVLRRHMKRASAPSWPFVLRLPPLRQPNPRVMDR